MRKVLQLQSILAMFAFGAHETLATSVAPPSVSRHARWSSIGPEDANYSALQKSKKTLQVGGKAVISLTLVRMPSPESLNSPAAESLLISNAVAGELSQQTAITNPVGYVQVNHRLYATDLIYSTNTPMWAGQLNPPPPFNDERGQILAVLLIARSAAEADDLSPGDITVTSDSNDGHILQDSYSFAGLTLTPQAPLVKADGTVVTSGSTSQQGSVFYVIFYPKMFNGGDTQAGITEDYDWIAKSTSDYTVIYTASISSDSTAATYAMANVNGVKLTPVLLSMSVDGSTGTVSIAKYVDPNAVYRIDGLNEFSQKWQLGQSVISGTNPVLAVPIDRMSRFYRARIQ